MKLLALLLLAASAAAPAAAQDGVAVPDPDEYAVWSAVIDSVAPLTCALKVADSAFVLEVSIGRRNDLMVAGRMEHAGFDSTAIDDYVARNARGVRVERRFSTRRAFDLVRTDLRKDFALHLRGTHLAFLSRPGFSRDRTQAVVSTATYCGIWCGYGTIFKLERNPDGTWRVARKLSLWIS